MAAILSVSLWYDLEANNQTMDNNAETDVLLTKTLLGLFQDLMLAFHEPDRSIGWDAANSSGMALLFCVSHILKLCNDGFKLRAKFGLRTPEK